MHQIDCNKLTLQVPIPIHEAWQSIKARDLCQIVVKLIFKQHCSKEYWLEWNKWYFFHIKHFYTEQDWMHHFPSVKCYRVSKKRSFLNSAVQLNFRKVYNKEFWCKSSKWLFSHLNSKHFDNELTFAGTYSHIWRVTVCPRIGSVSASS